MRRDRVVLPACVPPEQPLDDPDVVRVLAQALEIEPDRFIFGTVEGGQIGLVLEVEHVGAAHEQRPGAAAISRQRHVYRPLRRH